MLSNIAVAALAVAGAVNAGPLQRRQDTSSAVASVTSVASEASSAASSAVSSVVSEASSTAAGESSAASSTAASSAESSSAAATSTGAAAGNETNPAFPCPAGFLLTYSAVNQTVQLPVTQVTAAVGEWASSPVFPNVTEPQGGNEPGATHTINVGEIALPEVLVDYVANSTSGSAIWTWNGSLPEPVTAMGVSLASYSTVLQIYDPDYTTTGEIGNSTFINLFTNACATPQAEAMQLLMTLGGLELSNAAAALSGNSTSGGASSAPAESGAMSTEASMMSSTEASMMSSTAAESGASSAATSAASAASSGASSVASEASSAASSAVAAVTSTSA